MFMKDEFSESSPAVLIGAATLSADNTPPVIDLQGFMACNIEIAVGIGGITFSGTNKIEFVLKHGDASDGSDGVAVTDADMLGVTGIADGIIKSLTAAHAAAAVYNYGYVGGKRYLSLLADFSGTHGTGTPIAAIAHRTCSTKSPV